MGNASTIYDERCLDYEYEEIKNCPVYREHLETVKFVNQMGGIFEKLIYQNFKIFNPIDGARVSWYQLIGQSMKGGGQLMSQDDPFKNYIITTGKVEKLIGQMEDEFSVVCNSLILQPIQEVRKYCILHVGPLHSRFLENHTSLKTFESRNSNTNRSTHEDDQQMSIVREKSDPLRNLHKELHKDVIYVYEAIINLKLKIPALLEHQLRVNLYSTNYLEYLLLLFKEDPYVRKQIIPLENFKSQFGRYIPDYRSSLQDAHSQNKSQKTLSLQKRHSKEDSKKHSQTYTPTDYVHQEDKSEKLQSSIAPARPYENRGKRRNIICGRNPQIIENPNPVDNDLPNDSREKEVSKRSEGVTDRNSVPKDQATTYDINLESEHHDRQTESSKNSRSGGCGRKKKTMETVSDNENSRTGSLKGSEGMRKKGSDKTASENRTVTMPKDDGKSNSLGGKDNKSVHY